MAEGKRQPLMSRTRYEKLNVIARVATRCVLKRSDGVVLSRFENEERLYCGMKDLYAFLVVDEARRLV